MDFIPFSSTPKGQSRGPSPKQNKGNTGQPLRSNSMPAFGSPAIFPGVAFGSPAITTPSPNSRNNSSHQHSQQYTPTGYSHTSSPRTPYSNHVKSPRPHQQYSPFSGRSNSFNMNESGSRFKTPHQFSPGRGRGSGRKSISRQFVQTPRNDSNYNHGGSLNIEDYYHHSMIQDPWRNLAPVYIQT